MKKILTLFSLGFLIYRLFKMKPYIETIMSDTNNTDIEQIKEIVGL